MARDFCINGESLVLVKGRSDSSIGSLQQLGLAETEIRIRPEFRHKEINVDAWGEAPAEIQFMLAFVDISMALIHVDQGILDVCLQESMGGAPAIGQLTRAGARLGNNQPFGQAGGVGGNHYIRLNISSPVNQKPYRFYWTYMTGPPVEIPLGTTKSIFQCNFRAIPYTQDPWQGGVGALGTVLWDNTLDQ